MKKGREIRQSPVTVTVTDLPGNVIDMILGCLSVRDAVRTSAVCRDWRDKWKYAPKLVFDVDFEDENLVCRLLLQHRGNINSFAVYNGRRPDIFDLWITFLPFHSKLQDFTLHFDREFYPHPLIWKHYFGYVLPAPFYSFKSLVHLSLCRCDIPLPPPDFAGFRSLATLRFQSVVVKREVFEHFISRCPLLETLTLVYTRLFSFRLEAPPRLRCFSFHGLFENFRFDNSPLLARVSLSGGCLVRTVSFHLLPPPHPHALQIFDAGSWSSTAASCPEKLLDLLLYLDGVNEVDCALRSARTSKNLHKLRVSFFGAPPLIEEEEEAVIEFLRGQETPDHHLNHLSKVEITDFSGTRLQIEFVMYLMASAAGLEELLVISPPSSATIISDSGLMDMLKQSPRASPAMHLVVESRHGRMRLCYTYN